MDDRTDVELLTLAAKAAGMQWSTSSLITHDGLWITYPSVETHWNPLTDDGDALKLARQVLMSVKETSSSTRLRRIVDEPLAAINEVLGEVK